MKNKIVSQLSLPVILFLFFGCGRPSRMPEQMSSFDNVETINFSALNEAIFKPKCATCHANFTAYDSLMASGTIVNKNPEQSSIYLRVASGQMPKGGMSLSDTEVKAIYNWISNGSSNAASAGGGAPGSGGGIGGIPGAGGGGAVGGLPPTGGGGTGGVVNPPATTTPEPTFAWLQANVFNARCVVCHRGGTSPGGYDLSTFANVNSGSRVVPGNPTTSLLFQRVNSNSMPPGNPLSAEQKQMLAQWIQNGAQNNGTASPGGGANQPPPLPMLEPKFSSIMANIIGPRCLSCHDSVQRKGGVNLQIYRNLMNEVTAGRATSSELYKQVQSNDMPASGGALSFEQKEAIRQWINMGALEN